MTENEQATTDAKLRDLGPGQMMKCEPPAPSPTPRVSTPVLCDDCVSARTCRYRSMVQGMIAQRPPYTIEDHVEVGHFASRHEADIVVYSDVHCIFRRPRDNRICTGTYAFANMASPN